MHGFNKRYLDTDEKKAVFKEHKEECFKYGGVKIKYPEKTTIKHTQISKQLPHSTIIYADFESSIGKDGVHKPCGYALAIVSRYREPEFEQYTGSDAGAHFVKRIEELSEKLHKEIQGANAKMIYTAEDEIKFKNAVTCHICGKDLPDKSTKVDHLDNTKEHLSALELNLNQIPTWKEVDAMKYDETKNSSPKKIWTDAKEALLKYLEKNNFIIVRDHDHFTGEFRGAAHQYCNLNYKKSMKIPCFFHNFSGRNFFLKCYINLLSYFRL